MAIVYKATVNPSKQEIVTGWLDRQPWGGSGAVEVLGSYRFDDPDGEVGVEALLVGRDGTVLHVPLSYRGAELAGREESFVAKMQHSVLGERWVYDATGDPVAVDCFIRALRGMQEQATIDVWHGDTLIEHREPTAQVHVQSGPVASRWVAEEVAVVETAGERMVIGHALGAALEGPKQLVATWPGGRGVVAALVGSAR